jgi:murein L,D-transpeptidase YcbB/YkuD
MRFYEPAAYTLAWIRDGEPTSQAVAITDALRDAAQKGLNSEDYDGSRWADRVARLRLKNVQPSENELVRFDLALTVSVMRYISNVRIGRVNPKVFCFDYDVDQKKCNLAELVRLDLVYSKDVRAALDQMEPPFEAYRRTERALQRYLALARQDDGELLPATKKPVEPGDHYPGVPRLARLLGLVGDLPAEASVARDAQVYQDALPDAVKRFQERHGLDPDGRIGATTLKQLNTPLIQRVRQLQLTLERWRWTPDSFSRPPIIINIPEFRLRALNDRYEAQLEMKVIVGGAYRRQTPVFTNDMTHVIFRPYWNVPLSIQRGELVPKLTKDPAYLGRESYQVVDSHGGVVAWGSVTDEILGQLRAGKLAMRQTPGTKNALGHIKFMFPNEYNVYLHDTPTRALFSKSRRDFSHGCIRVEKPDELAAWVLRDKPEWTMDRIHAAEQGTKSLQVNLDKPIPVLIVYGTAVARASGEVCFFNDIYGHDASLQDALDRGYPYSGWKLTSAVRARRPHE